MVKLNEPWLKFEHLDNMSPTVMVVSPCHSLRRCQMFLDNVRLKETGRKERRKKGWGDYQFGS